MKPAADKDFFLGIDVGKLTLHAALMSASQKQAAHVPQAQFANTLDGQRQLRAWTQKHLPAGARIHACLEATGPYWQACALSLHAWATITSVVNARSVKAFGCAQLRRGKTDPADARLIALYASAMAPKAWQPPSELHAHLQAIQRRIDSLKVQRTAEKNRLEASLPPLVVADIKSHVRLLQARILKLESALLKLIHQDPVLAHHHKLLVSIPGIAERTAAGLLGELAHWEAYHSARQLAAHAGLTPRQHQSGQFQGRAMLCKIGSSRLRQRLYMSAIAAKRCSPPFVAFAHRLRCNAQARNKSISEKSIVCAIMRKLLHVVFGVLKHQQPFNPLLVTLG